VGIDLSLADYLLASLGVFIGALAQGTVGFGANLLAVPVLAIVAPAALPGTMIILPLPLQLSMIRNEIDGISWRDVGWSTLGRLPGVVLGTWIVTAVALDQLSVLTGALVLAGVMSSLLVTAIPLTTGNKLTAGFVSGVTGTATSIGGPPLALLYQHQEGRVLRPTLAACFLLGTALSLPSLALAGVMHWWHLRLAVALLPALLLGIGAGRWSSTRVDGRLLRPAVLVLAATAAIVAIAHGIG
jgi:uncharacterized membrane protein YfcA